MLNLLKIEYKKLIPYTTFWVIFGLFFLFIPTVFYGITQFGTNNFPIDLTTLNNFPNIWNNITYLASWFNLLIGILIVMLVCNEFTFKTFRQQVIDGQSKADLILAKILLMLSFAIFCTTYLFVIGWIFGLISGGDVSFLSEIYYLLIYFIQSLAYMSVGLIIAVLIRTSALSIILFLSSILLESMLRSFIPDAIDQFFPMKIISNLTPIPTPEIRIEQMKDALIPEAMTLSATSIVAIVYILVFWGLAFIALTKKDIS